MEPLALVPLQFQFCKAVFKPHTQTPGLADVANLSFGSAKNWVMARVGHIRGTCSYGRISSLIGPYLGRLLQNPRLIVQTIGPHIKYSISSQKAIYRALIGPNFGTDVTSGISEPLPAV
ncbi:unnamed protein product [Phytophthora fragariaefolia]|uniref:Unnamed protein product n=1 Tax=Phytophthora fragariaefolia TaxID=1490495 RepID=A0A9W7CZL5_9STRA|nr:unnamed protein product [Phytophthora fragariaefolia]